MALLPSCSHIENIPFEFTPQLLLLPLGLGKVWVFQMCGLCQVDIWSVIWTLDAFVSCQDELVTPGTSAIMVCGYPNL